MHGESVGKSRMASSSPEILITALANKLCESLRSIRTTIVCVRASELRPLDGNDVLSAAQMVALYHPIHMTSDPQEHVERFFSVHRAEGARVLSFKCGVLILVDSAEPRWVVSVRPIAPDAFNDPRHVAAAIDLLLELLEYVGTGDTIVSNASDHHLMAHRAANRLEARVTRDVARPRALN